MAVAPHPAEHVLSLFLSRIVFAQMKKLVNITFILSLKEFNYGRIGAKIVPWLKYTAVTYRSWSFRQKEGSCQCLEGLQDRSTSPSVSLSSTADMRLISEGL